MVLKNKLGFIRTYSEAVSFGPRSYGGLGMHDLRLESGLSTLELIIRSIRTPGYAQSIILTFLRHWQHVSGMPQPLLQFPDVRAPHLEGHFYIHFRSFLARHDLSLQIAGIDASTPHRENARCIMEVACNDDELRAIDINKIYYCKSYLQVKWISDLCNADGSEVLRTVKDGIRSIRQSSSRNEEVVQERPGPATWGIWQKFLRKHICTPRWTTTFQLGDWQVSANESDRLWPFYYSHAKDILYCSYRVRWHSHTDYEFVAMQGNFPNVYAFEPPPH